MQEKVKAFLKMKNSLKIGLKRIQFMAITRFIHSLKLVTVLFILAKKEGLQFQISGLKLLREKIMVFFLRYPFLPLSLKKCISHTHQMEMRQLRHLRRKNQLEILTNWLQLTSEKNHLSILIKIMILKSCFFHLRRKKKRRLKLLRKTRKDQQPRSKSTRRKLMKQKLQRRQSVLQRQWIK